MLNKNTLFILGAGASMDYGFPSGKELLEEILNILHGYVLFSKKSIDIPGQNVRINLNKIFLAHFLGYCFYNLHKTEKSPFEYYKDVELFEGNLTRSNTASIDDFISKYSKDNSEYSVIGKALIALAISECEVEDRLFYLTKKAENEHRLYDRLVPASPSSRAKPYISLVNGWYNILWEKLYRQGTVAKNMSKASVITFNYDRSIEQYLFNSIRGMLKCGEDDATEMMNNIPLMLHRYGQIGILPRKDQSESKVNPYKPIDKQPFQSWVASLGGINQPRVTNIETYVNDFLSFNAVANRGLRKGIDEIFSKLSILIGGIYTYNESDKEISREIQDDVLATLERVYFLGFGYYQENLDNLKFIIEKINKKAVYRGTMMGLTIHRKREVVEWLKDIVGRDHSISTMKFYEDTPVSDLPISEYLYKVNIE